MKSLWLVLLCSCATGAWTVPTVSHGPSIALTEIQPNNLHPVQFASGAGYTVELEDGFFLFNGVSWPALTLSGTALGSVISPNGAPAGALQLAPMVGTLGLVEFGPAFTPWTAAGGGFLQGGRPGTDWLFSVTFPFDVATAPPVGVSPGPAGYRRGGWADLFHGGSSLAPTAPTIHEGSVP